MKVWEVANMMPYPQPLLQRDAGWHRGLTVVVVGLTNHSELHVSGMTITISQIHSMPML